MRIRPLTLDLNYRCQPFGPLGLKGFSLVELLIVLTLTSFFVGSLVQALICFEQSISHFDHSLRRQQSLSAALFFMSRDIRMAGSNPMAERRFSPLEVIPEQEDRSIGIDLYMDKRGASARSKPDGDSEDPDEQIFFFLEKPTETLRRNGQPMALGIRENPGENPLFTLETEGPMGLVHIWLTMGEGENDFSLSTAVYVRNSL